MTAQAPEPLNLCSSNHHQTPPSPNCNQHSSCLFSTDERTRLTWGSRRSLTEEEEQKPVRWKVPTLPHEPSSPSAHGSSSLLTGEWGEKTSQTCTRQTIQSRRMGLRELAPRVRGGQDTPARSCLHHQNGCSPQPELGPADHRALACSGPSHRVVERPQQGLWDPCPDCQSRACSLWFSQQGVLLAHRVLPSLLHRVLVQVSGWRGLERESIQMPPADFTALTLAALHNPRNSFLSQFLRFLSFLQLQPSSLTPCS